MTGATDWEIQDVSTDFTPPDKVGEETQDGDLCTQIFPHIDTAAVAVSLVKVNHLLENMVAATQ